MDKELWKIKTTHNYGCNPLLAKSSTKKHYFKKMPGETNLNQLLKHMAPQLNKGAYVFVSVTDISAIKREDTLCEFKEREGTTVVLQQEKADELKLNYHFIASWITLNVHSALEAVGLTSAISKALTEHNISCNVIAGYYHDHIFVDKKDATKAMDVLGALSKQSELNS